MTPPTTRSGKSRQGRNQPRNRSRNKLKSGRSENASRPKHASSTDSDPQSQAASRPIASTRRLPEKLASLLIAEPDEDYALIDSGYGRKLERYGRLLIDRPEAQAVWQPVLARSEWQKADAVFTGDTEEEGIGRWHFSNGMQDETFPMSWDGLNYWGRFTSFRHTGVFPEQSVHWRDMSDRISLARETGKAQPKILNLFGYTGIASLAAARAGAIVTHVDASKKAIGWARDNQQRANLEDCPIRWICEDAVKFCEREVRRGNFYDGILLDPPAYGRGPKGEVWQIFSDLPHMVDLCRKLLSPAPMFVVLTAYAIRSSHLSIHELMQEVFGDVGGHLESGELAIRTQGSRRCLSTSMFSRWIKDA